MMASYAIESVSGEKVSFICEKVFCGKCMFCIVISCITFFTSMGDFYL